MYVKYNANMYNAHEKLTKASASLLIAKHFKTVRSNVPFNLTRKLQYWWPELECIHLHSDSSLRYKQLQIGIKEKQFTQLCHHNN